MSQDTVVWWSEHLSDAEAQLLLLRAAKEHSRGFTNTEDIGMEWAHTLKHHGYNQLGPYARNYLYKAYGTYADDLGLRRIAVS